MKVFLVKNVPNLGKVGEIKEVKPNYAYNFLFPNKLATLPTCDEAQSLKSEQAAKVKAEQLKKEEFELKLKEVDGKTFKFQVKADKNGHLYGSIGPREISEKLGLPEEIIKTHYKELGTHRLQIQSANLAVNVVIVIEQ